MLGRGYVGQGGRWGIRLERATLRGLLVGVAIGGIGVLIVRLRIVQGMIDRIGLILGLADP